MNAPSKADSAHELRIRALATDLTPVRRLRPPSVRTFSWLVIVAATPVILAMIADLSALGHRLAAAPDLWLAGTGPGLTPILPPLAAVPPNRPDARRAWPLRPLPAPPASTSPSACDAPAVGVTPDP